MAAKEVTEAFQVNFKKVSMPLLYTAITGKHFGPPLYDSFEVLGKDRCRARLLHAIEFNGGISGKKLDPLAKAWRDRDVAKLLQEV